MYGERPQAKPRGPRPGRERRETKRKRVRGRERMNRCEQKGRQGVRAITEGPGTVAWPVGWWWRSMDIKNTETKKKKQHNVAITKQKKKNQRVRVKLLTNLVRWERVTWLDVAFPMLLCSKNILRIPSSKIKP